MPSQEQHFTYPPSLVAALPPSRYRVDIEAFRGLSRECLRDQVQSMTDQRFALAEQWVAMDDWQFFVMVEMGSDRLQHRFLGDLDGDSPCADVVGDYYAYLDSKVGRLLRHLREDDLIMIVSDHGAQRNRGLFNLNQWLWENGYLVLHQPSRTPGGIDSADVDWGRTTAWAQGGYVGRIFLNIKGRDPEGVVAPQESNHLLATLSAQLARVAGDTLGLQVELLSKEDAYVGKNHDAPGHLKGQPLLGVPPDLTVRVDDLAFRVGGHVGTTQPMVQLAASLSGDHAFDAANHAQHGVLVCNRSMRGNGDNVSDATIYDIAPTILACLAGPEGLLRVGESPLPGRVL